MIFGIIIIGVLLISTSLKNTVNELGGQLQGDMLGTDGFLTWMLAILGLGALGYVPQLRTTSRYLIALLIVVLVLRNGGLWKNAQTAIQSASSQGAAPSDPTPLPPPSSGSAAAGGSGSSGSGSSSSSGSNSTQEIEQVAEIAAIALL